MGFKDKYLEKVQGMAAQQTERAAEKMADKFDKIIENQNEQSLAILTIYNLLDEMATKMEVNKPEPLTNMELEDKEVEL